MKRVFSTTAALIALVTLGGAFADKASANVIVNGDFQTGDLTGWTKYDTVLPVPGNVGELLGLPIVEAFDVTGSGASLAAKIRVGVNTFVQGSTLGGGGGFSQSFSLASAGLLSLSVDYASTTLYPGLTSTQNADGGTFSLLLDNIQLQSVTLGLINASTTLRGTLSDSLLVGAGSHTLSFQATRTFLRTSSLGGGQTPYQYFDNANAAFTSTAVPEPMTLSLFGVGIAGAVAMRRRKKNAG